MPEGSREGVVKLKVNPFGLSGTNEACWVHEINSRAVRRETLDSCSLYLSSVTVSTVGRYRHSLYPLSHHDTTIHNTMPYQPNHSLHIQHSATSIVNVNNFLDCTRPTTPIRHQNSSLTDFKLVRYTPHSILLHRLLNQTLSSELLALW